MDARTQKDLILNFSGYENYRGQTHSKYELDFAETESIKHLGLIVLYKYTLFAHMPYFFLQITQNTTVYIFAV